jgi:tRNA (guanosine-2'-O-)-methyltransferase
MFAIDEKELLVISHLKQYTTEHKREFIERVLEQRTRYVTVVLEDIYQSQNASAVIRTCECMGLQDIHIIENESKYSANRNVLKGAHKWMDMIRHKEKGVDNTKTCFESLRAAGYKILVTDPSPDGLAIDEVGVNEKLAIVMGNELHGISESAVSQSDIRVRIPMYGFTESLNISVSAAICLNTIIPKVRNSSVAWGLTETEKHVIRLNWLRKVVKRSDIIEREFLRTIS